MVTIVGGILVAVLTCSLQFCSARTQQTLAFRQQLRDKKYALLAAVAEGVHRDMIVLHKIKKMKGQLTERNQGQIFERAFAREEVWNLYQTVFEQYLKENRTSASMAQVEALFITPQVREQAKRLDEVVTHIDFNLSPESEPNLIQKLEEFYTDADGKLRKLEVAMADEINHT